MIKIFSAIFLGELAIGFGIFLAIMIAYIYTEWKDSKRTR